MKLADETLKTACGVLLATTQPGAISMFVTPNGDVVVAARRPKLTEHKTLSAALAHNEAGVHDVAECLLAWFEEHQDGAT